MSKDYEQLLVKLHHALGQELLNRVLDGTATSGDLSVALNLLKHNGISVEPRKGDPLSALMDSLPQFDTSVPAYQ